MKGVIANSFPKSGTHLLTRLLELLHYKEAHTHLSRSLIMYGPRNLIRNAKISRRIERQYSKGLNIDLEAADRMVKEQWFVDHISKHLKTKFFVQAHLPFSPELNSAIKKWGMKMLYIHRDPKDVLVSLKNYILRFSNHPNHRLLKSLESEEERFRLLMNGFNEGSNMTLMAPFCEKYFRSIAWKECADVCSVSFENIIGEKGGGHNRSQQKELRKICKFLDIEDSEMSRIQKHIFNTKSETFHKGTIGQWEEEFSEEIKGLFKRRMDIEKMKLSNL